MDVRFSNLDLDASVDLLALSVGSDFAADLAQLDARFGGNLLGYVAEQKFEGKPGSTLAIPTLGQLPAKEVLLLGIGEGSDTDRFRAAGHAGRFARTKGYTSILLSVGGDSGAAVEAVSIGNYHYDMYLPESDRKPVLETLSLVGEGDVSKALIRASWQSWARDLVNLPPADLYPESLARMVEERIGKLPNVTIEVWDFETCRKNNCVGIVAVGQASSRPGCLIRCSYTPPGATNKVALVGKGVTFDSGGLSIKPSGSMLTMKCDMGGAATMLAAFGSAAEQGAPTAIECFVGAVENMVGANSYKLGDILRYDNGVTVEIHNTDAEGRLVLADCLIQASRTEGVTHILDAATLTGAAVVALGPDYTALFTDDDNLAGTLLTEANANHDGLWRMPLHAPYNAMLKTDYAQIKNVGGRAAGSTTAALFLKNFVDSDKVWAHLDIAGPAFFDSKSDFYASGATGQMVRTLSSWLEDFAG